MDIFNRPPSISEDTLQYSLFLPSTISDKTSATTLATCIQTFVEALLPGFIWHRDAFELKVVPNPYAENKQWILEGIMRVGDCVDDEWCTVWLLKEISAKWDVVIGVFDSDGEFLLIEAADALPAWVKPTNSENRVWIYGSHLHLVPLSHISPPSRKRYRRPVLGRGEDDDQNVLTQTDDMDDYISAIDAVELVKNLHVDTRAPLDVERLVWQRISAYPAAARNHVHNTRAYLPIDIAKALTQDPSLVQKAVEAFYTRDAIQLRVAHKMSRFPPNTSVLRDVKMTRTAYAQLMGQKFHPPKVFGRWQENEDTPQWRWRDIGMKIAVGFEILYHENKSRADVSNLAQENKISLEAKKDALRRDPDYIQYINNLRSTGYFKGEMEDSALWQSLESKAAQAFVDIRREDDASRSTFTALVDNALSQVTSLPDSPLADEDPDSWLNVDAQDFENMLERTMGASVTADGATMDVDDADSAENRLASEQAAKLKELASKVEDFVEREGDLEGALFSDEDVGEELLSDEEPTSESESEEMEAPSAARQAAMENLVPGIDPSDYGRMPASYYENSQKVTSATIETEMVEYASKQGPESPEERPRPRVKPVRQPLLPRDEYEGADSDDETDISDEEEEEDRPQVVGEVEIDMDEEEEEFLEFARQALGISDEAWSGIVQDRRQRGAFLPKSVAKSARGKASMSIPKPDEQPQAGPFEGGLQPMPNQSLDSFEAVMKAMDEELARSRSRKDAGAEAKAAKGKGKAAKEEENEDIEAAMAAELEAALERGAGEESDEEREESLDYNLIKNFLASFKGQAGLSGPVSNLAGRLQPGWKLPRDNS